MGETAGDQAGAADIGDGGAGPLHDRPPQLLEAVPGDRRLEGVDDVPEAEDGVADVGQADEGGPPGAGGVVPALSRRVRHPAVVDTELEPPPEVGLHAVVGGFEAEQQQAGTAVPGIVDERLGGIDEPAGGREQPALAERARRPGAAGEVGEAHRGGGAKAGTRHHPQPGLGDHPQRPLGAEQEAVGAGAGAGGGQPPCLQRPSRGDRPHPLDAVVDVGVQRGVVARRAGRQPAAH